MFSFRSVEVIPASKIIRTHFNIQFFLGYPNLISIIEAFPDVFVISISQTSAACNEVSLNSQCIRK